MTLLNGGLHAQNLVPDALTIDHVLIAVDDLDGAKKEYEDYGFKVVYGGDQEKALNALIFLKDGTLIELIGKDRFPLAYKLLHALGITKLFGFMKDRITGCFSGVPSGFFNYSVYSSNLSNTYNYLKSEGLKANKPKDFKRKRDDGIIIKWQLIGTKPYDLPFIISDYIPKRISDSSLLNHANYAIALDTLYIRTNDFNSYLKIYNVFYQQEPRIENIDNYKTAYYIVKHITVVLSEASSFKTYFKKNDSSAASSFTIRCEGSEMKSSIKLNDYVTLIRAC